MYDEVLLKVDGAKALPVERITLAAADLHERAHLQEWVLAHPNVLGEDVEIVSSEYDKWATAAGDPVRDRLDVLALGPDGRLIVVELKAGAAPHTIHMQAINYASMVSRLSPDHVAMLYSAPQESLGRKVDVQSALARLESERLMTPDTIRSPRIVLVATHFPPSVTASVVWMNEQGVDISLLRFRPYRLENGDVVVSFSRLFPVQDVEEFTISGAHPSTTAPPELGPPWDAEALSKLAQMANAATIAMLDLCSVDEPAEVTVKDIALHGNLTESQVKGQLAGLTMMLKNVSSYGFAQRRWPVEVVPNPAGLATYQMSPELAAAWREIRASSVVTTDLGDGEMP